jgi:uncharacterized protein
VKRRHQLRRRGRLPVRRLIVLPIIDIYRKYYGRRIAALLLLLFYVAIAAAGYMVELVFGTFGLIPQQRGVRVLEGSLQWNYTAALNILFLGLSALLIWRFMRTGGPEMLRMMSPPSGQMHGHRGHVDRSHHGKH